MDGRLARIALGWALMLAGCQDVTVGGSDMDAGLHHPPPPPSADTSSPSDPGTRTFALRGLRLDQGPDWANIGYDLDGFYTHAPDEPSECESTTLDPDGQGGIDNRWGGRLYTSIQTFLPTLECEIEAAATEGRGTLLLRVERWNGLADDAQVTVSVARALDGTSVVPDCAVLDADLQLLDGPGGTPLPPPAWDGSDRYCVDPESIVQVTGEALIQDRFAYVSGGSIVTTFRPGAAVLWMGARSNLEVILNQGVLVAAMSPTFDAIDEGVVAGRFAIDDLITIGPESGVCDQSALLPLYNAVADVLSTPPDTPSTYPPPCDAISVGLAFTGIRADWAGVASEGRVPPVACDPAVQAAHPWPVEQCCADYPSAADQASCVAYGSSM